MKEFLCCVVLNNQVEFAYQQLSLNAQGPTGLLDITERCTPDYANLCVHICLDLGLRLGGVELIAADITQPLADYVIIQVDRSPDLLDFVELGELQKARAEQFYCVYLRMQSSEKRQLTGDGFDSRLSP